MFASGARFVPSLEALDERANPSTVAGTPSESLDGPRTLEGHQTLVFFLGGIPSRAEALTQAGDPATAADGTRYKPLFAPLVIDLDGTASQQLRPRMFAVVDRTQMLDGVVILTSSLPGGDEARTGPFFNFNAGRLRATDAASSDQVQGALFVAKQQALREFAGGNDSIWIDIDAPVTVSTDGRANETTTIGGPQVDTSDPARPTILLQRLANPGDSAPAEAADARTGDYSAVVFVGGWGSSGF
jgi:hypothetical protein